MGSETRKDLPDGSVRLSEEEAAAGRSRNCPRRLHSGRGGGGLCQPLSQHPGGPLQPGVEMGNCGREQAHRPGQAHVQATAENRINLLVKSQGSKGGSRQSMS